MELCAENNYVELSCKFRGVFDMHKLAYSKALAAEAQMLAANRARCVAFVMGHHKRLGAGSHVKSIDAEVLRIVVAAAGLRACSYLE